MYILSFRHGNDIQKDEVETRGEAITLMYTYFQKLLDSFQGFSALVNISHTHIHVYPEKANAYLWDIVEAA